MRVLMVSRGVLPIGRASGGAELVSFELAKGMAARGDDVVLVADVSPGVAIPSPDHLRVVGVRAPARVESAERTASFGFAGWLVRHLVGNVRAARRASGLLRADGVRPDVVHCHGALGAILLARSLRASGRDIPLLYTEHDASPWSCPPRGRVERLVRRVVYRAVNLRASRSATAVITNFPAIAEELAARTGRPRRCFTVIPNGAFDGDAPRDEATPTATGGAATERYCLFVGALIARKGPDRLMRALSRTRLQCVFVGDGPLRADLERLAEREGIAQQVRFTGSIEPPDVRRYYEGADVLVLPSVSEGVPLVALEALGSGVPVIASRLAGIASVVRDGVNGLLVEPGDDDALALALACVEERGEAYDALRRNAAAGVDSIPGWREVSERLEDLYERECAHREWREGAAGHDGVTAGRGLLVSGVPGLPRAMVELWALGGVGA